jgi:hypothetical protein
MSENRKAQRIADQRTAEDRRIAEERTAADREIARLRSQDDSLREYVEYMSGLLTEENVPLRDARLGDGVSAAARARTLTLLSTLELPSIGLMVAGKAVPPSGSEPILLG